MRLHNHPRAGRIFSRRTLAPRFLLAFALAAFAVALGCVPVSFTQDAGGQGSFTGQWMIEFRTGDEKVSLSLRYHSTKDEGGNHNSMSNTTRSISPAEFQGLTREQAMSAAGTQVRFQIRRDAGTLNCEGWFKSGEGSGHYTF